MSCDFSVVIVIVLGSLVEVVGVVMVAGARDAGHNGVGSGLWVWHLCLVGRRALVVGAALRVREGAV